MDMDALNDKDVTAYAAMERLRVSVAQIPTDTDNLKTTLRRHLAMIEAAKKQESDIVLFPELSLTGHSGGAMALGLARPRTHTIVQAIAEAAEGICVIFGMIEEGVAAQYYNAALAAYNGEIIYQHRKINLATYGRLEEGKHYAAGRYIETFELPKAENKTHWQMGTMICADMWNPALLHLVAVHGATALFVPISSAVEAVGVDFDNPSGWDISLRHTAMIYGMPVVMSNRIGTEDGMHFWGGSCIIDPFGKVMARAGREEELITANLDYEQVRKARYLLPTVRDSNLGLVSREYERLQEVIGVPDRILKRRHL